jgi:hypothetical protein
MNGSSGDQEHDGTGRDTSPHRAQSFPGQVAARRPLRRLSARVRGVILASWPQPGSPRSFARSSFVARLGSLAGGRAPSVSVLLARSGPIPLSPHWVAWGKTVAPLRFLAGSLRVRALRTFRRAQLHPASPGTSTGVPMPICRSVREKPLELLELLGPALLGSGHCLGRRQRLEV